MGQALDEHGNVLGEVTGPTKMDVFRKLTAAYPTAHELRIRSLMANIKGAEEEEGTDKSLSDRVADLERDSEALGTISATLWLNFGDTPQNKSGFTICKDTPLRMLLEVLDKLTNRAP